MCSAAEVERTQSPRGFLSASTLVSLQQCCLCLYTEYCEWASVSSNAETLVTYPLPQYRHIPSVRHSSWSCPVNGGTGILGTRGRGRRSRSAEDRSYTLPPASSMVMGLPRREPEVHALHSLLGFCNSPRPSRPFLHVMPRSV